MLHDNTEDTGYKSIMMMNTIRLYTGAHKQCLHPPSVLGSCKACYQASGTKC